MPHAAAPHAASKFARTAGALVASLFGAVGLVVVAPASPAAAAPTTFFVTTTVDAPAAGDTADGVCQSTLPGGDCTLRAAISEAVHRPDGGDTVDLPAGTYVLTVPGTGENGGETGDLDITKALTIQGHPGTVIDGNGVEGALQVFAASLTLDQVDIQNGLGAIELINSNGIITNSTISLNGTGSFDAGIVSRRTSQQIPDPFTLRLDNVTVTDNNSMGVRVFDSTENTTLITEDTVVARNTGDGIVTAAMTSRGLTVDDNGGFGIDGFGPITLTDSTVTGNGAGGVEAEDYTLVRTRVLDNAGIGIGVRSSQDVKGLVIDSTIADNTSTGVWAVTFTTSSSPEPPPARLAVLGSTVAGNGGNGISGDDVEVFNTTVSGNGGHGVIAGQRGPTGADIDHSTVMGNGAISGTNVKGLDRLTASVIADPQGSATDCSIGATRSFGHNVVSDDSCQLVVNDHSLDGTDVVGVGDVALGPLRDNGGPTATHFPLAGSPVLDRQPAAGCAGADQRGVPRPFRSGCDSGAVEAVFEPTTFTDLDTAATYQAGVRWTTREQILPGFTDNTWRPTKVVLRKHVVAALWQMAGAPTSSPPHPFTDVSATAPYADALDWAADQGIVTGTNFKPNDQLKRKHLVTMLWQMAGAPTGSPPHPFTDVPATAPYADALDWAADQGIVTGTNFKPAQTVNRGRLATQLWVLATTPDAWDAPPPPTVPFAPAP